ncbi:asparagine synthase (glutamine-hydrolysing) [Arcticibacter pallidicorallinus]|uniref:asparagine synthase (glutamine-hydrolyzing) n=1 Tax=Arcticibacter pallidicorallinus TaxID=1259464 RepID=A0A2T0TS16_9SPHI|nr:asparagine synthase (glutamine-hydrolyzing) [Arcticibacter pallidicorallinus]PRY48308.1 asparagine synthase (glutamine-hydrolysing) [Arcticibacter pallidicorallinus]
MCGIFGTLNHQTTDSDLILSGLYHRGPDEQNTLEIDNLQLFHTRLAIQDLSPMGAQPMCHNGLYIVFNGEIYNHMELRARYGLHAESTSDTLTILLLFEVLGMKMLDEFDGMFALALYDSIHRKLYLARDRAGKKPLYIYKKHDILAFSSELKTIYKVLRPTIDYNSIADYLYLGYHYRRATPYNDITELENGHFVEIDTQTLEGSDRKWFDITSYYKNSSNLSYAEAINGVDERLQLAIKRRIYSSDLDVGSFLSGGIDSGLVTAIASGYSSRLKTFTVSMEGAYDESSLARQVSEKYNTNHTVVDISFSDLRNDIESILTNYGEPYCDNSAIPSYYVAKAAKKHITVVLNGDGADELFGGYRRYVPFKHINFFNRSNLSRELSNGLLHLLPLANEKMSNYNYLYRLLKFGSFKNPLQMYSSASSDMMVGFESEFTRKPLLSDISSDLKDIANLPVSSLKKLLLMDFQTILFSGLLPKMDIATMAHSLEGRSPFLAKEVLEFAPSLYDEFKIKNIRTKTLLRDLAKKYLPDSLINQPKRGFEVPLKGWMDNELKEIVNSYLRSPGALYPEFINRSFVERLMDRKVKISDEKRAKILFCIFSLEVWHANL